MDFLTNISDALDLTTRDLLLLVIFLVINAIFLFSVGRHRNVILLQAMYIALAVRALVPQVDEVLLGHDSGNNFWVRVLLISAFVFILVLFLSPYTINSQIDDKNDPTWHYITETILVTGLMFCIALSMMPPDMIDKFSNTVQAVFTSMIGRFFWLLSSLIFLSILRGKSPE